MRARLPSSIASAVAAVILSGCYPSYLTSRPAAEISVTDESGAPLQGATVTLGTMEWHGVVGKNTLEKFVSDREGKVRFGSQHDWAMQVMLPDGDVRYAWSLCFSKPGFEAIPRIFVNFDEPIKVSMYPGAAVSECAWNEHEDRPRAKDREARWILVEGSEWEGAQSLLLLMDESFRSAMEESARQQHIKLRSWSEYRFQYRALGDGTRDKRVLIHAICRAPASFDLAKSFYSESDDTACFFETTYTPRSYVDQPEASFSSLQVQARVTVQVP